MMGFLGSPAETAGGPHEKGGVQMPTCKTRKSAAPVKKAAAKPVKAAKKKK
jgi:hypothetical protein